MNCPVFLNPPCCKLSSGPSAHSTKNWTAKNLIAFSLTANLSIRCTGCATSVPLYLLPFPNLEPSLSGFTNVSNILLRSNIPTPLLFGVVLNNPILALLLDKLIFWLLTCTSATNFTLNLVATVVLSDTENIICCPTGSTS